MRNRLYKLMTMFIIHRVLNGSGKLYYESAFDSFDKQHDGTLSKKEILSGNSLSYIRLQWKSTGKDYSKRRDNPLTSQHEIDSVLLSCEKIDSHCREISFTDFLIIAMGRENICTKENVQKALKILYSVFIRYFHYF